MQFALLVPVALTPIIVALMWAQHQAKRYDRYVRHADDDKWVQPFPSVYGLLLIPDRRTWTKACKEALIEIDFFGLLLIAVSLGLILLPLGLAPKSPRGWETPSMVRLHPNMGRILAHQLAARHDCCRHRSDTSLSAVRGEGTVQAGIPHEVAHESAHPRRVPHWIL